MHRVDTSDPLNQTTEIPMLDDETNIDTEHKLDSIIELEVGLKQRLYRDNRSIK